MFIIDNFRQRVKNTPKKIAVKAINDGYTYQELLNMANQLGAELDAAQAQEIVPFYLKGTRFVLPTVLGIWLAGRIPMPLVSALGVPEALNRVAEVTWDTLITDFGLKLKHKKVCQIVLCDRTTEVNYRPKPASPHAAYLLATSGSTGVSKKVFLTETNLKWILTQLYPLIHVNEKTKFLFSTPYSFDVSLTELLAPIVAGAELICLPTSPSKTESIRLIPKLINQEQITHLSLSPSFAEALLDIAGPEAFRKLKFLMVAGEAFPASLAQKLRPAIAAGCQVFNLYGPTETTVYATYHQVTGSERKQVPIGRPLPGATVKVFDKAQQAAQSGELYLGGAGVTAGYLLDPVKNRASFVTLQGHRYYKIGDQVTTSASGELIFLARADDQVQVNGIRVELGEVQTLTAKINGITAAAVKFKNKRLYVFYISAENKVQAIKRALPKYLNPIIIKVKNFLYTYNRKLDTKRMIANHEHYQVADQQDVLGQLRHRLSHYHVNEIDELDSLDLVRFMIEVENDFKIQISDAQIALFHTTERLATFIRSQQDQALVSKVPFNAAAKLAELLNLNLLFTSLSSTYEPDNITASSTQQSLFAQKKASLDILSIALTTINDQVVAKVRQIFADLATKIDLLKFAWFKDSAGKLYFKKINHPVPVCFVAINVFSKDELAKIMSAKAGTPIYCLIFNLNKSELEVVFSHHTIDASSANQLKKLFVGLYEARLNLDQLKSSSYADFMTFVAKVNQGTDLKRALTLVPKTTQKLAFSKKAGCLYVTKFACPVKTTDQVYIRSLYLLDQAMIKDHNMQQVTGKLALNIRRFNQFDASAVIGDTHATVPWVVTKTDTLASFA
ncbi:MAG: non-ribosomal peptide synthetase [Lactobacillus sp.]